jgi:hypothetical protein
MGSSSKGAWNSACISIHFFAEDANGARSGFGPWVHGCEWVMRELEGRHGLGVRDDGLGVLVLIDRLIGSEDDSTPEVRVVGSAIGAARCVAAVKLTSRRTDRSFRWCCCCLCR